MLKDKFAFWVYFHRTVEDAYDLGPQWVMHVVLYSLGGQAEELISKNAHVESVM